MKPLSFRHHFYFCHKGPVVNDATNRLRQVVANKSWGYHAAGPNASEPAAFACLALNAHNLHDKNLAAEALPLAKWLANLQTSSGSVGVTEDQQEPAWPTSLAMLAWLACDTAQKKSAFHTNRKLALNWTFKTYGKSAPQQNHIGHDSTIPGWSWAADTHSWLEPTCMFVLALKANGQQNHVRTRDGVRMITDRLLETGGCNYGNTQVLGQATLPHIQPTGLAMLAIADESTDDPRIGRSLDFLLNSLDENTATASLCFALLGLTAHNRRPALADALLSRALERELDRGTNCYKLALLSLANWKNRDWIPSPKAKNALLSHSTGGKL